MSSDQVSNQAQKAPEAPSGSRVQMVVVTGVATAIALGIGLVFPLASPLLVAMVLGAVVGNVPQLQRLVPPGTRHLTSWFLRAGVALLGLKISVGDLAGLGLSGVLVVLATVTATFTATHLAGRALGVERDLTTLIAAGFSICGAAAIAAVEGTIRAKAKDVALAVALVTIFGCTAMIAIPFAGDWMGLSADQQAVWVGASIHEIAQVVLAASLVSGAASVLALAMLVKLGRVALLVPVQLLSVRLTHRHAGQTAAPVPLFLVGFVVAVLIATSGVVPEQAMDAASLLTTAFLAAGMFGMGRSVVGKELWPVPGRVIGLATVATLVAGGVSLALTVLLV